MSHSGSCSLAFLRGCLADRLVLSTSYLRSCDWLPNDDEKLSENGAKVTADDRRATLVAYSSAGVMTSSILPSSQIRSRLVDGGARHRWSGVRCSMMQSAAAAA